MQNTFVSGISKTPAVNPGGSVYVDVFQQYERVIIDSLITSFGLDFIVRDQHGGDVDTIHNVRQIGKDELMTYKNSANQTIYDNRGKYDPISYHAGGNFQATKHQAREKWQETFDDLEDEYTGGKVIFGKSKSIPSNRRAELDHIVECKSIHDDRGRVLSGIDGTALANANENFAWTNKELNASMGAWAMQKNKKYQQEHGCDAPMDQVSIQAYVNEHPELDATTKQNLLAHYEKAQKAYDAKVNQAYYTSSHFFRDTTTAALKTGAVMGLKQALGLVFSEIWFAVRDAIKSGKENGQSLFKSIGEGVKTGFANAKKRYKELFERFIQGTISGVLSSLTTTLCNIFFTTAKNVVRIIRNAWSSLVEAIKILLFNPDNLLFGERLRAGAKVLATGASVVAGIMVSEAIGKTAIGTIPVVGDIVQTFCGTLVSGILSCSFLYLLDNNSVINRIVEFLNRIPCVERTLMYFREQAILLEKYSAELFSIDLERFKREVSEIKMAVDNLRVDMSEMELNRVLKQIYADLDIPSPFGNNTCDEFMSNRNNTLVFN
ncbi:MAG: hypothetical protein J6T60_05205 [Bacteroidales bacterium]|nr:hypothetical protein [Bacteroidales bacterium]